MVDTGLGGDASTVTRPSGTPDEVYDRCEAELKAGGCPRIEDTFARVAEPLREGLLRELVALEVTYRRRRLEVPAPEDYLARFPGSDAAVRVGFESVPDAARELFVGALALRLGLVGREALIDAIESWAGDKRGPLGRVLASRGVLTEAGLALLDASVAGQLALFGGDPRRGLAAAGLPEAGRSALAARRRRTGPGP